MPEGWEHYYDEVYRRAARVPDQHFDRERAFAEAAHEAYRTVANRLSAEGGWSDDRTLHVTHSLNAAMKQWIDGGECSWEDLRGRLRRAWEQATEGGRKG